MESCPITIITGPPAAGKTTLAQELAQSIPKSIHIPVDDIREWVVGGLATSIDWTDETERQFQIAEQAACGLAKTYASHGFWPILDHCRNLPSLNAMIDTHLPDSRIQRILLLPDVTTTLTRNHQRTNKDFDPKLLDDIIVHVHENYVAADHRNWFVLTDPTQDPRQNLESVQKHFQFAKTE